MSRVVVAMVVLCALAAAGFAQAPRERASALLDRANEAFARAAALAEGDPAKDRALREAAAAYGTVLAGGLDGAALRLNLAAVEAQRGDRGRAVLHLRVAGRLAMERRDDAGARAASAALRAVTPGGGGSGTAEAWPPPMLPRTQRHALRAAYGAGPGVLLGVFAACWGAGWLLLALRAARVARAPWIGVAALLLAGVVSGAVLAGAATADARADAIGVVLVDGALRVGPGEAFEESGGALAAGADVRVLDTREGWVKVRSAPGAEGWLREDAVGRVSEFGSR